MRSSRRQYAVAGLVVSALALWLFGGWEWVQSKLAARWSTTQGVITESRIVQEHDSDGTSYSPTVVYRYSLHDELFFGSKISLQAWSYQHPSDAAAIVARYPAGRAVTVHYDPDHPASSALEITPKLFPFNTVYFAVVGIVCLVMLVVPSRRRDSTVEPV